MPYSYSSWTNVDYISTGNALDAKYWNKLVAPRHNLDYLMDPINQSSTRLVIATAATVSATSGFNTVINWSTASYDPADLWDISAPSLIRLGFGIWVFDVRLSWSAGSAFSAKKIYAVSTNEGVIGPLDLYGESIANTAHQHSFCYLNTYSLDDVEFYVLQTTGGTLTFSAQLFLQKIPSAAALFDYP